MHTPAHRPWRGLAKGLLPALVCCALTSGCSDDEAPDIASQRGALTLFFDDFSNGLDRWIETGEGDWNTESLHQSTNYPSSASGSPAAHSDNCDTSCIITSPAIDLTQLTQGGALTFLRFADAGLDSGDYLQLEVSADGGTSWDQPAGFLWTGGAGDDDQWHVETLDLAPYLSSTQFQVRFVTATSYFTEHVHVDDVRIEGPDPTGCTSNVECDDGDPCTGDICNAGVCENPQHPVDTVCSDADAGVDGGVCNASGSCVECNTSAQCSDEDSNLCTVPTCQAETCTEVPLDCDDGLFCNGAEICNPSSGCADGPDPVIDDGISCTADSCDETNDQILHTPDSSMCNDFDVCTDDTCDPATGDSTTGCRFDIVEGRSCSPDPGYCAAMGGCSECTEDSHCPTGDICFGGACVCPANSCADMPAECGLYPDDGCGQPLDCTDACGPGLTCDMTAGPTAGVCVDQCTNDEPDPDEEGRDCGGPCPTPCTETACTDGLDEDGDGFTDCDDTDCVEAGQCDRCEERVLGRIDWPYDESAYSSAPTDVTMGLAMASCGFQFFTIRTSLGVPAVSDTPADDSPLLDCILSFWSPDQAGDPDEPALAMAVDGESGTLSAQAPLSQLLDFDVARAKVTNVRAVISHSSYDGVDGALRIDGHFELLGYFDADSECLSCEDPIDPNPDPELCSERCRCDIGEGGCRDDSHCMRGLVCAERGAAFGVQLPGFGVCVPEHCDNGVQDADETAVDCGGARCGTCPDCALAIGCSPRCPCASYEGPCSRDEDCAAGAACGEGMGARFGKPHLQNVCWPATCETAGCGSAACGPCSECSYRVTECESGGGTRVERISFGASSLRSTAATWQRDDGTIEYVAPQRLRTKNDGGEVFALFEGARTNHLSNSTNPGQWPSTNLTIEPTGAAPLPLVNNSGESLSVSSVLGYATGASPASYLQRQLSLPYEPGQPIAASAWSLEDADSAGGSIVLWLSDGSPQGRFEAASLVDGNTSWQRATYATQVGTDGSVDLWLTAGSYPDTPAPGTSLNVLMPQLELGRFPSSWIPTVGGPAQRDADRVVLDARSLPIWFFDSEWTVDVRPLFGATDLADARQRFVLFEMGSPEHFVALESVGDGSSNGGASSFDVVLGAGEVERRTALPVQLTRGMPLSITVGPGTGTLAVEAGSQTSTSSGAPWVWPREIVTVGTRGSGAQSDAAYAWIGEPRITVDVPATCDVQPYPEGTPCGRGAQACVSGSCSLSPTCGDGVLDLVAIDDGVGFPPESCDDGNNVSGDGCSDDCASEAIELTTHDVALHERGVPTHGVAADGAGRLLFVWQTSEAGGSRLLARRATSAGVAVDPLSTPIVIADGLDIGWAAQPQVVGLADGGWAVAWANPHEQHDVARIVYARVALDGSVEEPRDVTSDDAAGGDPTRHESSARVAATRDGFLIAWVDERQLHSDEPVSSVRARLFAQDGEWLSDEIAVTQASVDDDVQPAVAAIGNEWIAAWTRRTARELYIRRFQGATALEGEQLVTGDAHSPAVAALPPRVDAAEYALAWVAASDRWVYSLELPGSVSPDPTRAFAVLPTVVDVPEMAPSVAALGEQAYAVGFGYGDGYRDSDFAVVGRDGYAYSPGPANEELRAMLQADSNQRGLLLTPAANGIWFTWTDDGMPAWSEPYSLPNGLRAFLLGCVDCELGWGPGCYAEGERFVPDDLGATTGKPFFGYWVETSGRRAIVSAWSDDTQGTSQGAAYVYRLDGSGWYEEARLEASDAGAWGDDGARFGNGVGIDGDRAIVGAPFRDDLGESERGAAYIYDWDGTSWAETRLTSPDSGPQQWFGWDVDVYGDWAMVLASYPSNDVLHIFHRETTGWMPVQRFTSPGSFLYQVELGDGVALVGGATPLDSGGLDQHVRVLRYDGVSWVETQTLRPSNDHPNTYFGDGTILLQGDTAFVPAWMETNEEPGEGSVYVYRDRQGSWSEVAKLRGPEPSWGSNFGLRLAAEGSVLLVTESRNGSSWSGPNPDFPLPPRVHVYRNDTPADNWLFVDTISDPRTSALPPGESDRWGFGLGLVEGWALVANPSETDPSYPEFPSGALYSLSCAPGQGCGDRLVTVGEECDDGNREAESCAAGESCEVCGPDCRYVYPACGNGVVDPPLEDCDDGNSDVEYCSGGTPCEVCGAACTAVPGGHCGDGILQPTDEECDDGNNADGDGCSASCLITCVSTGDDVDCNGVDDDCDGEVDEGWASFCDDGESCTSDSCDPSAGGCQYTNVTGPCDDGDACTSGDACSAGSCVPGTPLVCDDENPCTDDTCNSLSGCQFDPNTRACDDGNACTTGDACSGGSCVGSTISCDDANVCTTDSCDPVSGCQNDFNTAPCDDGNSCTTGDVCGSGVCQPGSPINCDDMIACTADTCSSGVCNNDASMCQCQGSDVDCDDGDACTTDVCETDLTCSNSSITTCADGDGCCPAGCEGADSDCVTCTEATATLAEHETAGRAYSQGDDGSCTPEAIAPFPGAGDFEESTDVDSWPGTCARSTNQSHAGSYALRCAGTQSATTTIDASNHTNITLSYWRYGSSLESGDWFQVEWSIDGTTWTLVERSQDLSAWQQVSVTLPSSANNAAALRLRMTSDTDSSTYDAVYLDDVQVSGEPACSVTTWYAQGSDELLGTDPDLSVTLHEDPPGVWSTGPCPCVADGTDDDCNGVDNDCDGSVDEGWPSFCDDSNPCTDDTCGGTLGCQHFDNTDACDDGNACTVGDTCGAGSCQPGTGTLDCDDGNVCTDDSCDPALGCVTADNTASCDDGDPCTVSDVCSAGVCTGGGTATCDDGNACTVDTCDPATGCGASEVGCIDGDGCCTSGCDGSTDTDCPQCTEVTSTVGEHEAAGRAYQEGGGSCTAEAIAPFPSAGDFEQSTDVDDWPGTCARSTNQTQGGSYALRCAGSESAMATLDATGYSNITLSYWRYGSSLESGDWFQIEWSIDGTNWTLIERSQDVSAWQQVSIALPASADNASALRLRLTSDTDSSTYDAFYVDNVQVTGEPACSTATWYAQGSGELLGTDPDAVVTLNEDPASSGYWTVGPCPVTECTVSCPWACSGDTCIDAVQVEVGDDTTCALDAAGDVACFGDNSDAKLGYAGANSDTPVRIAGVAPAVDLAVGYQHACVVHSDGTATCWGTDSSGALGNGSGGSGSPTAVVNLTDAVEIVAGFAHTCARRATGEVACWGYNSDGQVGHGGPETSLQSPVAVMGLNDAVALTAGYNHTCAQRATGEVVCWGDNADGQLGDATNTDAATPVAVSSLGDAVGLGAGNFHTCAIRSNGTSDVSDDTAVCWGNGGAGRLGNCQTCGISSNVPEPVIGLTGAIDIEGGGSHTCAARADGLISCWGSSAYGAVGDGSQTSRFTPVDVVGISDGLQVSLGLRHSCALRASGELNCWGLNDLGQLGDGNSPETLTPVPVSGIAAASTSAAGDEHSCAIEADGTLSCWGDNRWGQLGDGTTIDRPAATLVGGLPAPVTHVGAGQYHTCTLDNTGQVYCWGGNPAWQLGVSDGNSSSPVSVDAVTDGVELGIGRYHSCAARATGEVMCWGSNTHGQLGTGTTGGATLPVIASGVSSPTQIDGGIRHTCALFADGTVSCWGGNDFGQLGDGTFIDSPSAVPAGVNNVTALALGDTHSCVLHSDQTISCFGSNGFGKLGDGTTADSATPVSVSGVNDAVALDAGNTHACAVRATGQVVCWGRNFNGQLGTGTASASEPNPVTVLGVTSAVDVIAGYRHSCAILADGSMQCWGDNREGQTGVGVLSRSDVPVMVVPLD